MPNHYGPLLRILRSSLQQSINAALESMELTSSQGHIMGFIAHHATPLYPRDVEEAFQLSHPTVSGILSRLEKKGFIAFQPDQRDRRCKQIILQPKGQECAQLLHETIMANERNMVKGFTEEEQAQLRSLLERAISNMGGWPECHNHKEEPKE